MRPETGTKTLHLTRENLRQQTEKVLDRGGWGRASVLICRTGATRLVVKDIRPMWAPVRWLYGGWVQRREVRILARLQDIPGVPGLAGRIDRWAFAMEWFDGVHFNRAMACKRFAPVFGSLDQTIRAMHRRGVVHLDLHEKKNVLITADDRAILLDFETALDLGRWGGAGRLASRLLERLDTAALLKFKGRFAPELLSEAERRRLRRIVWLSRLWLPKRVGDALKACGRWLGLRRREP